MRNGRVSAFVALGWIIVMVASCSYGREQATPSPTASAQVTEKQARAVEATATAEPPKPTALGPGTQTATIGGKLCFGSERIPPMTIFARNIDTGGTYMTQVERGQLDYTITVPAPADYILFAWTTGDPFSSSRPFTTSDSFGGIYSCLGDFDGQMQYYGKSRVNLKCYGPNTPVPNDDHTPIVVRVGPGEQVSDAFICDFDIDMSVPKP